jgi:hypothetical protein
MLNFTTALLYLSAALGLLYLDKTSEAFRSALLYLPNADFTNTRDPGHNDLVDNNNLYEHGVLQQESMDHEAKHDNIRFEKLKFKMHKMSQHERYVRDQHPEYLTYPHIEDVIVFIINGN